MVYLRGKSFSNFNSASHQAAFTLIEIIIVIALIAGAYTLVVPNLNLQTDTVINNSLGRLTSDVRSAYDLTVLSGKPHRMVFELRSGKYWLEYTDFPNFTLGYPGSERDLTKDEWEEVKAEFEIQFEKYTEISGEAVKDPETDKEIPAVSPVLQAKDKLLGPQWSKVKALEWQNRQLNELLIIKAVKAEHHTEPVDITMSSDNPRAYIYLLPTGYIEKSVIHIYYRGSGDEVDEDQEPYSITTKPHLGVAEIETGLKEVDFENTDREEEEI